MHQRQEELWKETMLWIAGALILPQSQESFGAQIPSVLPASRGPVCCKIPTI